MICVGMLAAAALGSCSQKADAVVNTVDSTAKDATKVVENATTDVAQIPAVTSIKRGESLPKPQGKPQIIDFNASWCGPCKRFAPTFDMIAQRYRDEADFYSINVDDNPELAANYNVESIPTVIYIRPDGTYTATMGSMDATNFNYVVQSFIDQI